MSSFVNLLFIICSWFVHSFIIRSLFVHYLFIICSLFVHYLFILGSLFVHSWFIICSIFVDYVFIILVFVHYLFRVCSLFFHYFTETASNWGSIIVYLSFLRVHRLRAACQPCGRYRQRSWPSSSSDQYERDVVHRWPLESLALPQTLWLPWGVEGPHTPAWVARPSRLSLRASAQWSYGERPWSNTGEEHDVQSYRHARQVLWWLLRYSPYSKPIQRKPQKRWHGRRQAAPPLLWWRPTAATFVYWL